MLVVKYEKNRAVVNISLMRSAMFEYDARIVTMWNSTGSRGTSFHGYTGPIRRWMIRQLAPLEVKNRAR